MQPDKIVGGRRVQRPAYSLLALAPLLWLPQAQAGSAELGSGLSLDYLANLTYSAAWRLEDADPALTADVNADDGNRNFKGGAMINNRLALLGELNLRHGREGLFLRGSAFYDDSYRGSNDNDSPSTVNKAGDNAEFTSQARRNLGQRVRLLDAYAYGGFDLGSTALDLRVGRQVVSWGESLFFPNASGAQSPADATKANVPGAEVKEILLPVGQVYAQWGLTPRWSLAAYWQWEWQRTELNPVGAYFSGTDVVGPGASVLLVPSLAPFGADRVPRGADLTPDDSGQWGVSTKFQVDDATEAGLYYLHYGDKNPVGVQFDYTAIQVAPDVFVPIPAQYHVAYADDIEMIGTSVSTQMFGTALVGELSYRKDAGINIDAPTATPGRADALQANLGFTRLILPTAYWDTLTLVGETSWVELTDVQPLVVGGTSYDQPSNSRRAGAAEALAQFGYQQVMPGWDLTVSLVYANAFKGKSAIAGSLGSLTGAADQRYSLGLGFKYLDNLELGLAYNGYHGTPNAEDRSLADRSNVSFSLKYSL
ncbi:MAG: DUF1302 family protein [Stagnimonas sp.]|nr:DUF1302 family protein [Stagnimonas sp.]